MQANLTSSNSAAPTLPQTPAGKLDQARARVKSALHAAEEDGDIDAATFDNIARPLVLALCDLDDLTMF
jgi:hypothetical protein